MRARLGTTAHFGEVKWFLSLTRSFGVPAAVLHDAGHFFFFFIALKPRVE